MNTTGRIWSVEDYYRTKEMYDRHGAVFNPALEAGSPAAYHVIAQHHYRATNTRMHKASEIPQSVVDRLHARDPIVSGDEADSWPPGLLEQLVADGSLRQIDNARSFACGECDNDHVEEVVYVKSPPGESLRAYIPCPERGRVQVPLDRLRRWEIDRARFPAAAVAPPTPQPLTFVVQPVAGDRAIPHALSVAHTALVAKLDEEIESYRRNVRFPNPHSVLAAIERYSHELMVVPSWRAELERRVSLVETLCAAGTPYDLAKSGAFAIPLSVPADLCRGKLAFDGLLSGKSNPPPLFAADIVSTREKIEAVLEEPSLGLSAAAREAFDDWRAQCLKVQREAERLEVDGCWYLYHIYLAAEPGCSERSQCAKAIMHTDMGGANLEPILAAANSIAAWIRDSAPAAMCGANDAGDSPASSAVKPTGKRQAQKTPAQRSWTQTDLNDAIQEYKAKRASTYSDLVNGVKLGKPGAKKSARELFGRNAIARALGVKSHAMVSNSPVWQGIADDLKLRGSSKSPGPTPRKRIGMDIALEEKATSTTETVVDQVVRQETIRIIQRVMPKKEAEATVEKLTRGEISDDQARELTAAFGEQRRDDRTRKVRHTP